MASVWRPGDSAPFKADTGFRVRQAGDINPGNEQGAPAHGSNAFLEKADGRRLRLWVNDWSVPFQMAGAVAQSRFQRAYYARNIVTPAIKVKGQTVNPQQYNEIALFVRECQLEALNGQPLIRLQITAQEKNPEADARIRRAPKGAPRQRGEWSSVNVRGYVKMVRAGATRFVQSYSYEFDFVIADVINGSLLGIKDSQAALDALQPSYNDIANQLVIVTEADVDAASPKSAKKPERPKNIPEDKK